MESAEEFAQRLPIPIGTWLGNIVDMICERDRAVAAEAMERAAKIVRAQIIKEPEVGWHAGWNKAVMDLSDEFIRAAGDGKA